VSCLALCVRAPAPARGLLRKTVVRPRSILPALLALLPAASCGDPLAAPPSRVVASTPQPASIVIDRDQIVWAANDHIDRIAIAGGPRQSLVAPGATELVVALDAIYWRSRGPEFGAPSRLMFTDAVTTRDVTPPGYSIIVPVGLGMYSSLLGVAVTEEGSFELIRLSEGWSQPLGSAQAYLGHLYVGPATNPRVFVALGDSPSSSVYAYGADGGEIANGVRRLGGMAFGDDTFFWIDRNYEGRPGELYRLFERFEPPELLAEIDRDTLGPWWGGERLWMIDTRDGVAALVDVDPFSGEMRRYELDHVPAIVTMTDAGFASWSDGHLRWQPLP
jgi:hypothetical protein